MRHSHGHGPYRHAWWRLPETWRCRLSPERSQAGAQGGRMSGAPAAPELSVRAVPQRPPSHSGAQETIEPALGHRSSVSGASPECRSGVASAPLQRRWGAAGASLGRRWDAMRARWAAASGVARASLGRRSSHRVLLRLARRRAAEDEIRIGDDDDDDTTAFGDAAKRETATPGPTRAQPCCRLALLVPLRLARSRLAPPASVPCPLRLHGSFVAHVGDEARDAAELVLSIHLGLRTSWETCVHPAGARPRASALHLLRAGDCTRRR